MIISQPTDSFRQISETIARGGVIGFRTDTFYGLGADPLNRDAIQRIKQLKGSHNPILIIISDLDAVNRFIADRTADFDLLVKAFWPGPLTLIGSAVAGVPDEITAGTQTVGVRLPGDENVRALVRACGGALTATSANPSGQEPATTAQQVSGYFGGALDLIVDGGEVGTDQPSTVLDVSGGELRLIREGAITWGMIQTEIDRSKADEK